MPHDAVAEILALPQLRPRPIADIVGPAGDQPRIKITRLDDIGPALDSVDLVEGLLGQGAMSVIYGQSNSGKTFVALDLALRLACGWPWRDRAVEPCGVVYCAMEGTHGIRNRIAAFKMVNDVPANVPFGLVTVPLEMLRPETPPELIAAIRAESAALGIPTGLIVMDTLARALGGANENSSEDMGLLVMNSDLIRADTKSHIMWIHHAGKDDARGARGHSSLRAATDTELEVVDNSGNRVLRVRKQREYEGSTEFPFALKSVDVGVSRRGKTVTSCVVIHGDEQPASAGSAHRRLTGHKQRALEVLATLLATAGQAGHTGVPSGVSSVPEHFWRDRFYQSAVAGANDETKRKTFRRAADDLVGLHIVGMANNRVWIVARKDGDKA